MLAIRCRDQSPSSGTSSTAGCSTGSRTPTPRRRSAFSISANSSGSLTSRTATVFLTRAWRTAISQAPISRGIYIHFPAHILPPHARAFARRNAMFLLCPYLTMLIGALQSKCRARVTFAESCRPGAAVRAGAQKWAEDDARVRLIRPERHHTRLYALVDGGDPEGADRTGWPRGRQEGRPPRLDPGPVPLLFVLAPVQGPVPSLRGSQPRHITHHSVSHSRSYVCPSRSRSRSRSRSPSFSPSFSPSPSPCAFHSQPAGDDELDDLLDDDEEEADDEFGDDAWGGDDGFGGEEEGEEGGFGGAATSTSFLTIARAFCSSIPTPTSHP